LPGYVVDPEDRLFCLDVDECAVSNGGCHQNCSNYIGGFECSCFDGYIEELSDPSRCERNPCDVANCSHQCAVTPNNTAQCFCYPDYVMIPSRPTECAVADVCHFLSGGGCDQECINLAPGDGYKCGCPLNGFKLGSDEKTCEPCTTGFYGPDCKFACVCDHGVCDRQDGHCDCDAGYMGVACNETCNSDYFGKSCRNPCTCRNGGQCNRFNGSCLCSPGWIGDDCGSKCSESFFGRGCLFPCRCQNGATCFHVDGLCQCASGYTGDICDTPCPEGSWGAYCTNNCTCQNGATCSTETGVCDCAPGYKGTNCAIQCDAGTFGEDCINPCNCLNGASCDHVTGNCTCLAGYTGLDCGRQCPEGKYGLDCESSCLCQNGATCDHVNGSCTCAVGWQGNACEIGKYYGLSVVNENRYPLLLNFYTYRFLSLQCDEEVG
jgi:hypothetical protein